MKRTLFLSVLFGMLLVTAHAENESHQQVDSTLYAYYRWCNNNIRDTAVLSKADTLFRLSGEKHDIRMQAVALSMKADHYYFRFLSVRLNRLKNKLLANYLRNRGNDLATVRNSAFCVAILSNNSFICKYNIFFRKYELSVAIL